LPKGGFVNVLSLCSGIGGLELGVKLAEPAARCVCYVECEAYAAAVLVRRMQEELLDEAPIWDYFLNT
jgi:DNA (cytosine-5)-methyltransferase 1